MNQFLSLIINFSFSFIISTANAQATRKHHGNNIFQSNLAIVVGVLSLSFILIILVIFYLHFFHVAVPAILNLNHLVDGRTQSSRKLCGLEKSVIGLLPSFRFSSLKGLKEGLECAICISKFEDDEVLKLLPNCNHAFHKNCIGEWLERKSSCPLCRYKFKSEEFTTFTFTNYLGIHQSSSNLSEDANFNIFIQREQEPSPTPNTSKFNFGSNFMKIVMAKKEVPLFQEGDNCDSEQGKVFFHKFKHKIVVSDIVYKKRWSDLNSSDLLCLSSEMLDISSSQRFSPQNNRVVRIDDDTSKSGSSSPSFSSFETSKNSSKQFLLNPAVMRSMSEIKTSPRYEDIWPKNSNEESSGNGERVKSLWFDIATKTIHGYASQARNSQEAVSKKHLFHL